MIDCEKPGDCAHPGCDCPEDDDPFDEGCPLCGYDCAGANPPIADCPMRQGRSFPQGHQMQPHDLGETRLREKIFYRAKSLILFPRNKNRSVCVYYGKLAGCIDILRAEFSYPGYPQTVAAGVPL